MKQIIYKYTLGNEPQKEVELELPVGSTVVDWQQQDDGFQLWVLLDKEQKDTIKRKFVLLWTGKEFEYNIKKIYGTRHLIGSGLIYHLIEI